MPALMSPPHYRRSSALRDRRRTRHHRGRRISRRRPALPDVRIGDAAARASSFASPTELDRRSSRRASKAGARRSASASCRARRRSSTSRAPFATGLHQVDNPVFDRDGNLYVTYSGTRGQQVPVSIFRVRAERHARDRFRPASSTRRRWRSIRDGRLYVSSRFEGTVYRVAADGRREPFATDLGVACGLAFAPDGTLFVGDRSGTIFRVDRDGTRDDVRDAAAERRRVSPGVRPRRRAVRRRRRRCRRTTRVYRIAPDGDVDARLRRLRPAAGPRVRRRRHAATSSMRWPASSGLYRVDRRTARPELRRWRAPAWSASPSIRRGGLVVASNDTVYRLARAAASVAHAVRRPSLTCTIRATCRSCSSASRSPS